MRDERFRVLSVIVGATTGVRCGLRSYRGGDQGSLPFLFV